MKNDEEYESVGSSVEHLAIAEGAHGRVGIVPPPVADFATQHGLVTLRFRDPQLERTYLQGEYSRIRRWSLGSLVLGLAITPFFYPLDSMFIAPSSIAAVHAIRLLVMAVSLIGILGVLTIPQAPVGASTCVGLLRRASIRSPTDASARLIEPTSAT